MITDIIAKWLEGSPGFSQKNNRPMVTLSYAQSMDGFLTSEVGKQTAISGPESMVKTHRLRAMHDAILVGIGTVLIDNPQLNVRLAEGHDPQPVILDSQLKIPIDCHLLKRKENFPWIVTSKNSNQKKKEHLELLGARIIQVNHKQDRLLDLREMLACLSDKGINSLMVEGGTRVIHSFLSESLIDQVMITIAPIWLGIGRKMGQVVFSSEHFTSQSILGLDKVRYMQSGTDMLIAGKVVRRSI